MGKEHIFCNECLDVKIHTRMVFATYHRTQCHSCGYVNTMAKDAKLRQLSIDSKSPYGYFQYITIYECEFNQQCKQNSKMQHYVSNYKRQFTKEALIPRDVMRGGRTNVIQHCILPNLEAGYRLYYLDYTSLYPAVNFGIYGEVWPIGQPTIYIGYEITTAPPFNTW